MVIYFSVWQGGSGGDIGLFNKAGCYNWQEQSPDVGVPICMKYVIYTILTPSLFRFARPTDRESLEQARLTT